MAKKDRTGNRKTREQRTKYKVPELGYYLIVTDTGTLSEKTIDSNVIEPVSGKGKGKYIFNL